MTELEQQVAQAKTRYSVALRNLEQISEQIHARRRGQPAHTPGQRRSSPVGAEAGPDGGEDADSGIIEGQRVEGWRKASAWGLALPRTPHTLANLSFRHSGSPEGKEETTAYMNSCVPFSAAASAPSWSGGSRAGTHEGGYWGWCRRRRGSQLARRRETRTRLGR